VQVVRVFLLSPDHLGRHHSELKARISCWSIRNSSTSAFGGGMTPFSGPQSGVRSEIGSVVGEHGQL